MNLRRFILFIFFWYFQATAANGQPVHWWTFDGPEDSLTLDSISEVTDSISGYFGIAEGVSGRCLKCDGYTTAVYRKSANGDELDEAFTIEVWIALQTLPWNWTALVNQGKCRTRDNIQLEEDAIRFFLGVNAFGQVGMKVNIDGIIHECVSKQVLPLLKWSYVCGTYNKNKGIHIYINGEQVGSSPVKGSLRWAGNADLVIGKSLWKMGATGSEREASAKLLSDMVLDGLIDEVKIHDRVLSAEDVKKSFITGKPENDQPLKWRSMPSGPADLPRRFDAINTRLRYTDEWEHFWRVGEHPDILVQFDELPVRFIFWRGTSYGGAWISENGKWMGDQSLERAGEGKSPWGCSEHMSDKQCRYSCVSIVEKTDARVVVRWRYAISDITYDIFGTGTGDGWGEWAVEYYVIYPDGVSTRHQILWTDYLSHEWQETIVLNQPGTRPEDNIDLNAMSLANMEGKSKTFSWNNGAPESFAGIDNPNIQITHLKSQYKPFIIFEPGPKIKPFRGAIRPEYSHFPWWNHWPVAQIPNDGRRAFGPDRPSHSSLSQSIEESDVIHKQKDGSYTAVSLIGMTDKPITDLVPLARSWNNPANVTVNSPIFSNQGYDKNQRSYLLRSTTKNSPATLNLVLQASEESPVCNPAFLIRDWGKSGATLTINGDRIERGRNFRYGHLNRMDGIDIIVWIQYHCKQPVRFVLSPEVFE